MYIENEIKELGRLRRTTCSQALIYYLIRFFALHEWIIANVSVTRSEILASAFSYTTTCNTSLRIYFYIL